MRFTPFARGRRRVVRLMTAGLLAWQAAADAAPATLTLRKRPAAAAPTPRPWPLWDAFLANCIEPSGRVRDTGAPGAPTVSEAQAYAMFFALVAGDAQQFATLYAWTRDNLARGDLAARLPAWKWGRADDDRWGVLDENAASDADLWLACSLIEAGRRFDEPDYARVGRALAERLAEQCLVDVRGLGPTLLPAALGFRPRPGRVRLNPSYAPLFLVQQLAAALLQSRWPEAVAPALRLAAEAAPHGVVPEWVLYDERSGWQVDEETRGEGSYNAVRAYLWAGLLGEPTMRARLLGTYWPWLRWIELHGFVPEKLDSREPWRRLPVPLAGGAGFEGCAMVLAEAAGRHKLAAHLRMRALRRAEGVLVYYEHALLLFANGWMEGRYRFAADGRLLLEGQFPRAVERP